MNGHPPTRRALPRRRINPDRTRHAPRRLRGVAWIIDTTLTGVGSLYAATGSIVVVLLGCCLASLAAFLGVTLSIGSTDDAD